MLHKPAAPAGILGQKSFCPYESGVVYTTGPVPNAVNYLWTVPPGSAITGGQGTLSITVAFGDKAGSIRVRSENMCGNKSKYTTFKVTLDENCRIAGSSAAQLSEFDIEIYPNPVSHLLNLNHQAELVTPAKYTLNELNGKVVIEKESWSNETQIDVTGITPGLYVLKINAEGKIYYRKIVVE